MKCENCKACQKTSHEYPEYECVIGIDDEEFKDGTIGCRLKAKTINKRIEQYEDSRADEWSRYAEFMEESDKKDNALRKAIEDVLFNDWILCRKFSDGEIKEVNTSEILKNHTWEIRSNYEDLLANNE